MLNSIVDKAARNAAGVRCCVIRLRFMGSFLPAYLLMRRPWPTGLFVSTDCGNGSWGANLHPLGGDTAPILRNHVGARVVKTRADGCWLVAGARPTVATWGNGLKRGSADLTRVLRAPR